MPAKSFLREVAGALSRVFGVQSSAGAANAGDIVSLNESGFIDPSMMSPREIRAEYFFDFPAGMLDYVGAAFSALAGGNGSAAATTAEEAGAFGTRVISSSSTANSGAYMNFQGLSAAVSVILSQPCEYRGRFKIPSAALATTKARFGFQGAFNTSDETHEVSFVVDGGAVTGRCRNASSQSSTTGLGSISGDTWYTYKIMYTSSVVWFYLYSATGALISSDSVSANIPTNVNKPWGMIATNSGTTAQKILIIDYVYCSTQITSRS